jgi:hypothetical protein
MATVQHLAKLLGTTLGLGVAILESTGARAEFARFEISADLHSALKPHTFGDRGPAQKIATRAIIAVDSIDPHNAIIADFDKAPRNANGTIEVVADVTILRPANPDGTTVHRNNEVDSSHPLLRKLAAIREGGARIEEIKLAPRLLAGEEVIDADLSC